MRFKRKQGSSYLNSKISQTLACVSGTGLSWFQWLSDGERFVLFEMRYQ